MNSEGGLSARCPQATPERGKFSPFLEPEPACSEDTRGRDTSASCELTGEMLWKANHIWTKWQPCWQGEGVSFKLWISNPGLCSALGELRSPQRGDTGELWVSGPQSAHVLNGDGDRAHLIVGTNWAAVGKACSQRLDPQEGPCGGELIALILSYKHAGNGQTPVFLPARCVNTGSPRSLAPRDMHSGQSAGFTSDCCFHKPP